MTKFRRIAQIAQKTYFLGSVIFMNLFFGSDFSWYLFFWVSQEMPGPSPPVMCMSEYTPWEKDEIRTMLSLGANVQLNKKKNTTT